MSHPWFFFTITKMLDRCSAFDADLYDASGHTGDLNADASYINNDPSIDPSTYIPNVLGFKRAGQAYAVLGNTVDIEISNDNTGQKDSFEVSVVPASQSLQGVTLTNEEGTATIIVYNPTPFNVVPVSISWVCDNDAQLISTL